MPSRRSSKVLPMLFAVETVVDLPVLRDALGGVSAMTVSRHLKQVSHRCSYSHNGRYYALHDPSRYDRHGLWSHDDIHFSRDGSLKKTVSRMVGEAEAGMTHEELSLRLRVRVHNTLLVLVRESVIGRVRIEGLFHYFHPQPEVQQEQLRCRRDRLARTGSVEVEDEVVIRVLLVLIRNPESRPGDVVRHLRGRSPPVGRVQVDAVFCRYGLAEKGGPRIY